MIVTVLTVLGLSLVFGVGLPALTSTAARVAAPELTTADGGTVPARGPRAVRLGAAVALLVVVVAVVAFAVWLVATGGTK
ncbi:hypothetical protein [Cellulomonas fimi]|uniref:hypothetical protein n=1 Tax=Cellulomonas fimi TaxID=1708 RepID=UPI0002EC2834|nr:hypothetical protein [Cellulomonas fimi]NNH05970.1 hypothetical protein [Cellulomonas fimi]VEH37086.1 Uncharacterised protein [Cellulomonas fimi]